MHNNVMAIVAHPDDELIGVGGTLIKHVENGDRVSVLILGTGISSRYDIYENKEIEQSREIFKKTDQLKRISEKVAKYLRYNVYFDNLIDQRFDIIPLLEIVKIIESWIFSIKPNIVYTHSYTDLNIDHRLTFDAVLTATRPCNNDQVKKIYAFETLSSTEWQFQDSKSFKPNYFNAISLDILNEKIAALRMYKDELRESPHPRSIDKIIDKASVNGSTILKQYAEAFEIIRIIKD